MESLHRVIYRCKKLNFQKAFKVLGKDKNAIPLPDLDLNTVSDYYSYYVGIMEVPENVFWHCDIGFVKTVAINKQAFSKWTRHRQELLRKTNGNK